jgi:hypothetical protein
MSKDLYIFVSDDIVLVLLPCTASHASRWTKINNDILTLILLYSIDVERYDHPCGCTSIVPIGISSSDLMWLRDEHELLRL